MMAKYDSMHIFSFFYLVTHQDLEIPTPRSRLTAARYMASGSPKLSWLVGFIFNHFPPAALLDCPKPPENSGKLVVFTALPITHK